MKLIFSILSFLLLFVFILYTYYYFSSSQKQNVNIIRGFRVYPILGTLPDFLRNRHRFLNWSTEILSQSPTNTAIFFGPGKIHGVVSTNPLNVKHVLKTNFENYPKGERVNLHLKDFLGQGIFNSDGELWKIQRKTASYEFNTKSLRNFIIDNVRVETFSRLIPVLNQASETQQVLDLQDVLEQFSFDNICKLAFNVDPGCLGVDGTSGSEIMRAFEEAATLSFGRFMYAFQALWKISKFFNIGSEKKLKNSIKIVHEFADNIIKTRLQQEAKAGNQDEDLLSRFIKSDSNSPEFLRDIIISFIFAGRDSTSSGLSWFFWLLSLNPNVEQNILKELESIRQKKGKNIGNAYTFDELREMQYLHAAISESLRLYPPVAVDTRASVVNDLLPDGTFIGKDWLFTYHIYAMGRMEKIWGKNCKEYLPERWLDENGNCKQESPFRFPIFHAGPRMCLGKDMAFIQMKSIVVAVLERFEVEVLGKHRCPKHLLSLTFRMKGGLPVRVKKRS